MNNFELYKEYDNEHFIEMIICSNFEPRIEYYTSKQNYDKQIKRKLEVIFCEKENEYCILETNYNIDGTLLDINKGYTFRRIYSKKTIGYHKT